jgi:hypothetical protein
MEKMKQKKTKTPVDRYRLCTKCRNFSHYQEEQEYCIVCGEKMIEECPGCKEPIIYPTAKHCHKCGKQY